MYVDITFIIHALTLILASVFVEGMATIVLGLAGFFLLPGPAKRTKFLNERERMIAIQRLVNDDEGGNTAVCSTPKINILRH